MVTTIEGRPRRVTSRPLKAPQSRPTNRPISTISVVPAPNWTAAPMAVDASAMIDATDRSISPEMIRSAMGKAIIAFSVKLNVASDRFQASRKYGDASELATKIARARPSSKDSQRPAIRCRGELSRSGIRRWPAVAVMSRAPPA